jgi:25S rRNA (adenine2142-N1)-methyltransferase
MILEQDFMERPAPLPEDLASDGFDIVSLSLVVNYVGDSVGRGEMLRRVGKFLRERPAGEMAENLFPGLFFVLPAPCVLNSRFLNEHRLGEMLASLGFTLARRKMSNKLVYYYWTFRAKGDVERKAFEKKELRKGGGKNNFCIILR